MGDPMEMKERSEEMNPKPKEAKVIYLGVLTTKPLEDQNLIHTSHYDPLMMSQKEASMHGHGCFLGAS